MKKISMSIDVTGVSETDIKQEISKFLERLSRYSSKKVNYTYSILDVDTGYVDSQEFTLRTR